MLQPVVFYTNRDRWRLEVPFDRAELHLGRVLHVEHSDTGVSVSPDPADDRVPHAVTWISPSSWSVLLEAAWEVDPRSQATLESLLPEFSRAALKTALQIAAADVAPRRQYRTDEYRRSRLHTIEAVLERLDLVERLNEEAVAKAIFHQWEPLVVYLLLTCFDLLGQPADWMTFEGWLVSRRTEAERAEAAGRSSGSPVAVALALHEAYQVRYGVKNAFFRFLHEVLAQDDRRVLLDSLRMHRLSNPPHLGQPVDLGDHDKEVYLFSIRNSYTHRAQFAPGVHGSLLGDPSWTDGATVSREQWIGGTHWTSVATVAWPAAVRRAVVDGLAGYLRALLRS